MCPKCLLLSSKDSKAWGGGVPASGEHWVSIAISSSLSPALGLSDDADLAGVPAAPRGAGLGAVEAAGAVAEGGAEGHRAERRLPEVPLLPLLLNF